MVNNLIWQRITGASCLEVNWKSNYNFWPHKVRKEWPLNIIDAYHHKLHFFIFDMYSFFSHNNACIQCNTSISNGLITCLLQIFKYSRMAKQSAFQLEIRMHVTFRIHRKECRITFALNANFSSMNGVFDILVAHGQECHNLHVSDGSVTVTEISRLECDHEEADTWLILHAQHAAEYHPEIVLYSPDTDVAVIALSHMVSLDTQLYFATGIKHRARLVNLNKLAAAIGSPTCKALIGLHCFTGCDTVSSFYGKGKKTAFEIASNDESFTKIFQNFGKDFVFDETSMKEIERFVCQLYGQKGCNVNTARYKAFCLCK